MNKSRRDKANEVIQTLQSALVDIEYLIDEEQDALDGIPENMQTRVERSENTKSDLDDAKTAVEDAVRQLEAAVDR